MGDQWYVGVDLGGTKIAVGLVREGRVVASLSTDTEADGGPNHVIGRILRAIDDLLVQQRVDRRQVAGIGVGAPGPLDSRTGTVITAPNLPGWDHVPLRDIIAESLDLPAAIENDANAAALGEARFGAARGAANMIFVTVSTGIGGGIVINHKLMTGATGAAGEIGHMVLDVNGPRCGCGNYGCWEALASGTAIARDARRAVEAGQRTAIAMMAQGSSEGITARTVYLAAIEGDRVAQHILGQASFYLGVGFTNLLNLYNPEVIVIGGGLAKMGDLLIGPALDHVRARAFAPAVQAVRFAPAALGDEAGVLGAAALLMNHQESQSRA